MAMGEKEREREGEGGREREASMSANRRGQRRAGISIRFDWSGLLAAKVHRIDLKRIGSEGATRV